MIAECRTAGYLVERLTPGGRRLYALMAGMSSKLPDELRALLGELISDIGERVYLRSEAEARQRHDISVISAPVYDHHRRQIMVVSLQIGRAMTDSEIARHAKGLTATAMRSRPGWVGPNRSGDPVLPPTSRYCAAVSACSRLISSAMSISWSS